VILFIAHYVLSSQILSNIDSPINCYTSYSFTLLERKTK